MPADPPGLTLDALLMMLLCHCYAIIPVFGGLWHRGGPGLRRAHRSSVLSAHARAPCRPRSVISASLATAWVDGFRVHWYLQPVAIGQENAQYNADRKGLVFIFTFLNTLVRAAESFSYYL